MLRTRLLLSFVPFVVILLAIGVYAIALFSHIAGTVDVKVPENYQRVLAAQSMKLYLSRMEEGVLIAVGGNGGVGETEVQWNSTGNNAFGSAVFRQNQTSFEEDLQSLIRNADSSPDSSVTRRLAARYESYLSAATNIFALDQIAEQRRIFREKVYPGLHAIDHLLDDIYHLNHNAILATTQNTEDVAVATREVQRLMVIGILLALVIASYACFRLGNSIHEPIQSLTRATQELGKGNLGEVRLTTSINELRELVDAYNKMIAQLKDYRRRDEEKIDLLHGTTKTTLDSFPDPIFILNRQLGIDLMNLAGTELLKSLELKNRLPQHLREAARKALTSGESFLPHSFQEVVSFRLNGHEKSFLPRILAMRNEENAIVGAGVALYDVTRFRLLDDAKTNLVATVSHEIRTPLTSVRMALHLLLERTVGPLNPEQHDLLIAARDDAERLLRILNDLLDLTRLEQGNTDLRLEKMPPALLVQSVADGLRDAISAQNLKLECRVEPHLPDLLVDPQRINYVFTNLINNAIKYSPPGGEIILQAGRTGEREVQFQVIDRGPGVPEDFHDRIFDRFFRVPGQTKTGAGLGLSIAREIVVAHGGRIGVKNPPKGGSEFYFVLAGEDE
jgi:signal transduction histidine kinase